jgi:hypothetical protein
MVFGLMQAQGQINFEQYCYVKNRKMATLVPILNYETPNHLYIEGRYNYEELNTLSLYVGKNLTGVVRKVSYSVIPLIGVVAGQFKGGSAGFNAAVEYSNFFFSTQSQYTVSINKNYSDFYFTWCELGYQPLKWVYAGFTVQQTYLQNVETLYTEPGFVLGFSLGKFTLPLYVFNPLQNSNYFVLGLNLKTDGFKRNR